MKKIKIYQEDDKYVMERINQFDHSFKERHDNSFSVEERLRDYAENGEDYTVEIKLENKIEQEYLEMYCDRTINLKTTTWKGQNVSQELER